MIAQTLLWTSLFRVHHSQTAVEKRLRM